MMKRASIVSICLLSLLATAKAQDKTYSFGEKPMLGAVRVKPDQAWSLELGYGYDGGEKLELTPIATISNAPFFFSAYATEGNYRVTVTFGDLTSETDNTVNAELRRLMVESVKTKPGEFVTRSFIVNVRTPAIAGTDRQVRITTREQGQEIWAWDRRLTLEFNGARPGIAGVRIEKVDLPTIYLIGDSTVCDQDRAPFNSWGQMFTRFIKPTVAISNHAESGESTAGALGKGRFDKLWAEMKKGDYLLMQFGHNDMKATQENALETFKTNLRRVIDETRARGGTFVLFTPVSRRSFDQATKTKITNSFVTNRGDDYAGTIKLIAAEKNVPLIDLQSASAVLYETLGDEESHKLFATMQEGTHHGDYGSYQIAQCVVQLLKQSDLAELKSFIVDEFKGYDPAKPQLFADFKIPTSPRRTNMTPPGN